MPFLVGAFFVPLAALIGAGVAVLFVGAISWPPFGARWHFEAVGLAAAFAILFAAPVTLVVLPVGYRALCRSSSLTFSRFALMGMAGILLSVAVFVLEETIRLGPDTGFLSGMTMVSIIAAIFGIFVGFLYALVMRWMRPEEWITNGRAI